MIRVGAGGGHHSATPGAVFSDHHVDHRVDHHVIASTGTCTVTVVPPAATVRTASRPPAASILTRCESSPMCPSATRPATVPASAPTPSSATRSSAMPSVAGEGHRELLRLRVFDDVREQLARRAVQQRLHRRAQPAGHPDVSRSRRSRPRSAAADASSPSAAASPACSSTAGCSSDTCERSCRADCGERLVELGRTPRSRRSRGRPRDRSARRGRTAARRRAGPRRGRDVRAR